MADGSVERVVVTVDDMDQAEIESVARALRAAGMQVNNVLTVSGIITGEVASDKVHGLASVPGVKAVEPDEEMRAI